MITGWLEELVTQCGGPQFGEGSPNNKLVPGLGLNTRGNRAVSELSGSVEGVHFLLFSSLGISTSKRDLQVLSCDGSW